MGLPQGWAWGLAGKWAGSTGPALANRWWFLQGSLWKWLFFLWMEGWSQAQSWAQARRRQMSSHLMAPWRPPAPLAQSVVSWPWH